MTQPIAFALSVLALLVVPGPTNTLLAAAGATRGIRRSWTLLIGELAGYIITIVALRQTLSAVANESSSAQLLLKCAVAAYLVFLAIRLWRAPANGGTSGFTLWRVFVTTLLNPKGFVFALFIFPVPPTPIVPYFVAFSAMVITIGATWIVAGSLITQFTNPRFGVIAPKICACAMAAFAMVVASGLLSY